MNARDDDGYIDWERGWVSPDGELPLISDAWLPEDNWVRYPGSSVVTLPQVRELPALVLLGDPGSGKSACLRRECAIAKATKPDEDEALFVDLGLASDARDLRERVFDDPTFLVWHEGTGRLHLFLDSLDEAKVQIRHVLRLLEEGLARTDLSRIVLRVACRTADRPRELERWLDHALGGGRSRTLELAPLRVSETKAMALTQGVDAEQFIDAVVAASVAPFAARPLSLKMLLRVFVAEGGFPDTLAVLYEQALLLMAGEETDERWRLRKLTDTAAFAVAARVAAATVLSGRDVVGASDPAVQLRELSGGTEVDRLVAAATGVAVDEGSVREALGTALFTARSGGVGWAHRTFGEYLAAYWLAGDRLTDAQVEDLLLVDDGSGMAIVPPLRNVAGWLLGMRPSLQRHLRPADSLVLVYGDPTSVAVEVRRALLPSLLDALDDQQVERRELRSLWRRVGYDGIEDDLRTVLTDARRDEQTRQAAADAVAELGLVGLMPSLVDLAVEPAQSIRLRTSALYALREFRDDVPLDRIRPLAIEPQASDDDDQIKGAALDLCWPRAMSAGELFMALTPEKNEALLGAYSVFLHGPCAEHLTEPDELLLGIRWGLTLPRGWHDTRNLSIVADRVVTRAWPLAATMPVIAEALADVVEAVTPNFMPILMSARSLREDAPDSALDDASANLAILTVLVRRAVAGTFSAEMLERAILRGMADVIDMSQVIDAWASAPTEELRAAWEAAIPALTRGDRADAIFDVKETYGDLYKLVAWRYEPIALDSPTAEALRQQHARDEAAFADLPTRAPVDPADFDRQIVGHLQAFVEGDIDSFWQMMTPLFLDDDGFLRDEQARDDITRAPGWLRMAGEARGDLLEAAEEYLRLGDPAPDQWLTEEVFFRPAHAGYCALKLLFDECRAVFDAIDASVWRTWAPVVLAQRRYEASEDQDDFRQAAYARIRSEAPDVARRTVLARLPVRLHGSDIDTARDRLRGLWDATLDEALFGQLARDDLELGEIIGVVGRLLVVGREEAVNWASERITREALLGDESQRGLALGLAGVLAAYAPRRLWDIVVSIAAHDDAAARVLLARLIDRSESGWEGALEPAELGELFGMLDRLFPRDLDAPEERSFHMTIEMQASMWRSRILERLVAEGSPHAVAVIAGLEEAFDENGWIRRMRHRAQEEVRRAIWAPPAPDGIVRMGSSDRRRHVADAPALRRLVMDALTEIAAEMRGTRTLAQFLWNLKPYRLPMDENYISNMLVEWLRARIQGDKAIINREVQVNPRTPQSADRTDIHIQATSHAAQPLTVVIEVKGAWNDELMTAMDEQLATKYLKPDLTDQGIYLVFWFARDGWDDFDSPSERARRSRATRESAEGLAILFEQQAAEVSEARGVTIDSLVIDGSVAMPGTP